MTDERRVPGTDRTARLAVISGPSGVGKSAVAERLLSDARFGRAVTATTRAPRGGERDGVDYWFLPRDEFLERVAAGWFLEHAEVYGNLYGTPRSSVEAVLASGRHCVLVIDVQGAATLRAAKVDAFYVFLTAPTAADLEKRLRGRGLDAASEIARRLATAEAELREAPRFDRVVTDDSVEVAAQKVATALGLHLT